MSAVASNPVATSPSFSNLLDAAAASSAMDVDPPPSQEETDSDGSSSEGSDSSDTEDSSGKSCNFRLESSIESGAL